MKFTPPVSDGMGGPRSVLVSEYPMPFPLHTIRRRHTGRETEFEADE